MKYEVTARRDDALFNMSTFQFPVVMDFLTEHENDHCEVVDGSTGEIMCYFNCPNGEPGYMSEEFELLTLGLVYRSALEEEAKREAEKAEARAELIEVIRSTFR